MGLTLQLIHTDLDREICRLRNEPFNMQHVATLGQSIGYLMPDPQWRDWPVRDFADIEFVVPLIMKVIELYGVPYLERYTTLAALYVGVCQRRLRTRLTNTDFEVPVMLKALNRTGEAIECIAEQLAKWQDKSDVASVAYAAFVRRFLAENQK